MSVSSRLLTAMLVVASFRSGAVLVGDETPSLEPDAPIPIPADPLRQFDFWLGEWTVENRHLQPDGSWRAGGVAKARIQSVLGGQAILERWTGQDGLALRGFSLRTYDPEQQRWEIILNWHSGAPSTFSLMVGNFTEDRGEFFPPTGAPRTRFTFSRARPESCQWDQATSPDGDEWTTNWIMSFSRSAPARALQVGGLEIEVPHASVMGKAPESRQLDALIGVWTGEARRLRATGATESGTAERRTTAILDGYALLELTRFSWGEESISVLCFDARTGLWTSVGLSSDGEPDCHWLAGSASDGVLTLAETPTSDNGVSETWSDRDDDEFQWRRECRRGDAAIERIEVGFRRHGSEGRITEHPPVSRSPAQDLARARARLRQGLLGPAAELLTELVTTDPRQPAAQFLLGYALHALKKYDAAEKAYRMAEDFPETRAGARYNLACLAALRGRSDDAFRYLRSAKEAGFEGWEQLAADPDLAGLRDDPRFQELLPRDR